MRVPGRHVAMQLASDINRQQADNSHQEVDGSREVSIGNESQRAHYLLPPSQVKRISSSYVMSPLLADVP